MRYTSLTTTISHDNNNHRTSKHASKSWRSDGLPSFPGWVITRVGPGQNPQHTRAHFGGEAVGCAPTPRHTTMSPRKRNTITSVSLLLFFSFIPFFHFSQFFFFTNIFRFFHCFFPWALQLKFAYSVVSGPIQVSERMVTETVVLGAMADPGARIEVPQVVQQLEELPGVRELQQLGPRAQSTKERFVCRNLCHHLSVSQFALEEPTDMSIGSVCSKRPGGTMCLQFLGILLLRIASLSGDLQRWSTKLGKDCATLTRRVRRWRQWTSRPVERCPSRTDPRRQRESFGRG